jgi:hypothetical protein
MMLVGKNRKKRFFAVLSSLLAFGLLNFVVSAARLDRTGEEAFYSDIYSVTNQVLPNAKIPFANTSGVDAAVNSLGFRGPETTWDKPPGRHRLVSVGDSSTFGALVDDNETYTARIAARLTSKDDWEAVNCGIPGTNILQQRLLFELKLRRLRADIVMVYVVPNVREDLDALRGIYEKFGPGYEKPARKWQRLLHRLPVYRLLLHAIKGTVSQDVKSQVEMIYREHRDAAQTSYFADGFEADLRKLRARILESEAKPLWIWHINRENVDAFAESGIGEEMLKRNPFRNDLHVFYGRLAQFVAQNGDPFVNPYPPAVAARRNGERIFADEIHPNPRGHEIIAKAVWEILEPMIDDSRGGAQRND